MKVSIENYIIFLILSIISFVINLIFYVFKKKKYSLTKLKVFIIVLFSFSTLILINILLFFILTDSEIIIESFADYALQVIFFNISIALFCISIIIFLVSSFNSNSIIQLDLPSRYKSKVGSIKIGRVMKGNAKKYNFYLSIKDLEKHMFICGSTGTGKSNFLQNFLINFKKVYDIPFFLVEFKGEYHFLQKLIEDVLIIWPGENFSINIFNPEKANPLIHAERLFDILKSGQFLDENSEFSPQMERVLVDILIKTCKDKMFQNWKGFEHYCEEYLSQNQNIIPMLSQTLISIKNRIRRFSTGPLKALFETTQMLNISDLFKKNIILDLSSIIRLGGEKEDALFFLNMILKYLWDENLTQGAHKYKGIKHITIVEDAQYFAPQDLNKKNKLTTYLEDIALLQRGTGECLISLATRPNISKHLLANNGIVLTFKNHLEKELMCELLNLDIAKKSYLSLLEEGQCILRANSIKETFLLGVPHIKREPIIKTEIEKNNHLVLTRSEENVNKKSKSINEKFKRVYINLNHIINQILKNKATKLKRNVNKKNLKHKTLNNFQEIESNACLKGAGMKRRINTVLKAKSKTNQCLNEELSSKSNKSLQYKINLRDIFITFVKVENLYKKNDIKSTILGCQELIKSLLEKISKCLGFSYKNMDQFLNTIISSNLDKKFILNDEIYSYKRFLTKNFEGFSEPFTPEFANFIFSLTKKILFKLKSHISNDNGYLFSNGYDISKNNSMYKEKTSHTLTTNDIKNDDNKCKNQKSKSDIYNELRSYINELYRVQQKNK